MSVEPITGVWLPGSISANVRGGDGNLSLRPWQTDLSESPGAAKAGRTVNINTNLPNQWLVWGRRPEQQAPIAQDMTWRVSQGAGRSTWLNSVTVEARPMATRPPPYMSTESL